MSNDGSKKRGSIYDEPMTDDRSIDEIYREPGREPPRSGDSGLYPDLADQQDFSGRRKKLADAQGCKQPNARDRAT